MVKTKTLLKEIRIVTTNADNMNHFATTVQKSVTKATVIEPREEIRDASVEYCVSSGYVLISDRSGNRALVTHISNVVLELQTSP